MSACPHCRRLREERDEAREALRQAREALFQRDVLIGIQRLGFTKSEALILEILLARGEASKPAIFDHLYGDDPNGGPENTKILEVFVCRMKPRLRRLGVEIETIWGKGWRLGPASQEALRTALSEQQNNRRGAAA